MIRNVCAKKASAFLLIAAMLCGLVPGINFGVQITNAESTVSQHSSGLTQDLNGIAYGNNYYVAVGAQGRIFRSADGLEWSAGNGNSSINYSKVAYGNGIFVATAGNTKVYTSTDGLDWVEQSTGSTGMLMQVRFVNGYFYACGHNASLYESSDGISWSKVTIPGATGYISDIAYGQSRYVVAAVDRQIYYSDDNKGTWQAVTVDADDAGLEQCGLLTFQNNKFIYSTNRGFTWSSADGITWGTYTEAIINKQFYDGIYANGTYILVGSNGLYSSIDGSTYTQRMNIYMSSVTYENGLYVAAGNGGILVSSDAVNWRYVSTNLKSIAYGNGVYAAVGDNYSLGDIYSSTDFSTWTYSTPSGNPPPFASVVYGNSRFVAVGTENSSGKAVSAYSDNGTSWTLNELSTSGGDYLINSPAVAFGGGNFVAVSYEGKILCSSDGVSWNSSYTNTDYGFTTIKYINGKFIAGGYKQSDSTQVFLTSSSGTADSWTLITPTGHTSMSTGITYGNSKYISVANPGMFTSTDLSTWTAVTNTDFSSTNLNSIDYGGDDFVAVGADSSYTNGVVYTSADGGITWTSEPIGTVDFFNCVAYENSKFDIVGYEHTKLRLSAGAAPVEITAFDTIANVPAGTAGNAAYASAAAVVAALPAGVQANNNTVTVPVSTWVNTDGYNPNAAGSYTFTATLGTLPAGYANTANNTATVEVVVTAAPVEITAFDTIANVSAGAAGNAAYANAEAVILVLPASVQANNNTVTVPVSTWVNTDGYNPNAAGSYTFTATLGTLPAGYANTANNTATVEVVVTAAPVEITAFDTIANVPAGAAGNAAYANAAAVTAALPASVQANNNTVTVPVSTWVNTDGYNPNAAGSYTFTATLGTLPAGYANTADNTATVEVVVTAAPVEITAFDTIANVSAGAAGNAAYANAAAVTAALPASVQANNNTVTVPVSTWVNTDGYNPDAAGSYTFTAMLGNLPAGYANTANHTATVEVVVTAAGAPILQLAVAGDRHVSLNWSPVPGSTGYKVYVSTISGNYTTPITTVTGSAISYDVAELSNGTNYYFVVKATNPDGDSAYSNEVSAVPKTIPGAPTNVTATAGNGQATVCFTAPIDNGGSPITGYVVTSNPGNITILIGTGTSVTVTGLTNGTAYTFTVKAVNAAGAGQESAASNSVTPYTPSDGGSSVGSSVGSSIASETTKPGTTGAEILVNGKNETAATVTTAIVKNQTVTTVTIDDKKIQEKLNREGNKSIITIPVNNDSDVVATQLNGQTVKNMETKEAVMEVKTQNATYTLPASQINIDQVSSQLGQQVELKDILVHITISESSQDTVRIVEGTAKKNDYQIVVKPVDFEITCKNGNKAVDVSEFNGYVERMVAIPDGIDPSKITTGIVLNMDGTFSHVPTTVIKIGQKNYAKINSLTNSTYAIIWSPKTFTDVETHWAKDAVNDMGSRLVIDGAGNGNFEPDRSITRAEFAVIVVNALGLMRPGTGKDVFRDVTKDTWYYDAVSIAYEYGIISGYGDGKFGAMDKITREQAMAMIANAMKITGLKVELKTDEADELLATFGDSVQTASWANESMATCVKAGIVSGKSGKTLAPKDEITRAEVATIVRSLLKKSDLI